MSAPVRPLVVRVARDVVAWIEAGRGWLLTDGRWAPLEDAPGVGGRVLLPAEVASVVAAYGRPTERRAA